MSELEEHWSLIQEYIQSHDRCAEYDLKQKNLQIDTESISSYSCGPNEAREPSDDPSNSSTDETIKNEVPKAGQAYTSADNALIWQAYSNSNTPESRRKALGKVAAQLGRSYNGIVRHVRHLREQRSIAASETNAYDSFSGSESDNNDSSSSNQSEISFVVDSFRFTTQSKNVAQVHRVVRGTGFLYTEEEDMDIWAAYLSTTNRTKRTEALRAVAARHDRKYAAVMYHLKKMFAAQSYRYNPTIEEPNPPIHAPIATGGSRLKTKVVNQVSDVSDSPSESEPPAVDLVTTVHSTDTKSTAFHSAQLLPTQSNAFPHEIPSHLEATTHTQSYYEGNRYNVRTTTHNGTPITFCGDTAKALADYRATVPQTVYAPETVNDPQGLSCFVKSLRVSGLDLVFPVEAYDQVCTKNANLYCI